MPKIRVGVLRGGPSSEYEVSLRSGEAILKNLPEDYVPVDVFIDRQGDWHILGTKVAPGQALRRADVFFNVLHGEYGESGEVQELLNSFGVPYTGAGSFASRLSMNKALTKDFVSKVGVKTPMHIVFDRSAGAEEVARKIFHKFLMPVVIKPIDTGSSVGVVIAKDPFSILDGVEKAFSISDRIMAEEYIAGKEATCAVVEDFNNENFYALPPIEIVPKSASGFFDYDAKYNGQSEEICPGRFSESENAELRRLSSLVHETLGLRHYSRSDFIIHPKRGIYFLEVNNAAGVGLTEASLLPKALKTAGASLSDFIKHVINKALGQR